MKRFAATVVAFAIAAAPAFAQNATQNLAAHPSVSEDAVMAALAANSHIVIDVVAPGVLNLTLVSSTGDTLLAATASHNIITIDGMTMVVQGTTAEFYDGGQDLGGIDMSRTSSELATDATMIQIASHLAATRHGRKPLYEKLLTEFQAMQNAQSSESVKGFTTENWCSWGAGCACNIATAGAEGAAAAALLATGTGAFAAAILAFHVAWNQELDACGG